jgi:very-short-patch-repair endonuclease
MGRVSARSIPLRFRLQWEVHATGEAQMTRYFNREIEKDTRRSLRKTMTPAEVKLWQRIRHQQLGGYKFRRQYSVGPYILDFHCVEAKLAIEVDGESHYLSGASERDRSRQDFIEKFSIRFLRFTNVDIHENLDGVIELILRALNDLSLERS